MKFLVTGAAGFVGSHLCEKLLIRGNSVVGLDDLSKGKKENIDHLSGHSRFTFVTASLGEAGELPRLVKESDLVYHLAAVVGVRQYVEDPVKVVVTNVCETTRLLELAWQYRKKVVFTSTSEVYGKSRELPFREDADRLYGSTRKDRWCYAVSKSAAEHLCTGYARKGLPLVILRYFNVYGPRADSTAYGGVVTRFIDQALVGEPLTVHGDGSQTRCFTYIDDIVEGTVEASYRPAAEGKIINLGSRRETSIRELAEMINGLNGGGNNILFQPYREFYGPHYEDIPRRVPELGTAESVLGYNPKVSLESGLQKTLEWYRASGDYHRL